MLSLPAPALLFVAIQHPGGTGVLKGEPMKYLFLTIYAIFLIGCRGPMGPTGPARDEGDPSKLVTVFLDCWHYHYTDHPIPVKVYCNNNLLETLTTITDSVISLTNPLWFQKDTLSVPLLSEITLTWRDLASKCFISCSQKAVDSLFFCVTIE